MDLDKYGWQAKDSLGDAYLIPISILDAAREFDRAPGQRHCYDRKRWQALRMHLSMYGILNPIILHYNPDSGKAFVRDGCNRIQAALSLEWEFLPALIKADRGRKGHADRHIQPKPLPHTESGAYLTPSEVGI